MKKFAHSFSFVLFLIQPFLQAEAPLRLKVDRPLGDEPIASQSTPAKRKTLDRSHLLLRFSESPRPEQIAELRRRGGTVLQSVPDAGLLVSVPDSAELSGLGIAWAGRLRTEQKVSPVIRNWRGARPDLGFYIVESFPNVEKAQLRSLAEEEGVDVLDYAGLLPNHLLIRASASQLLSLAKWDEVAYVFPASGEVVSGRRVVACAGGLTALGPVGQYVNAVGDGWDGPGLGNASLGYFFERLTAKLPQDVTREQILQAMREWAKYASLSFGPAGAPSAPRTLNILFAAGNHGDAYPFDGPSRVLAHTFYPAPPNPEPIAGDLHFDDDEEWVIGPDLSIRSIDLYSVALHELGHGLGLAHSDTPGAVMYPYYRRVSSLSPEDVAAIQQLYATPDSAPMSLQILSAPEFPMTTTAASLNISGTVTGGSGNVSVRWTSNWGAAGLGVGGRAWTITALPLQVGINVATITATDADSRQVSRSVSIIRLEDQAPPDLRITFPTANPTYRTTNSAVPLGGTASHASGIASVAWVNSGGGNGAASGTTSWTAGPIALQSGSNEIRVTAYDATGGSSSRTLLVTREQTAPAKDTVSPSIRIISPSATTVLTRSVSIRVSGTASDNVGVTLVTWSTSTQKTGTAAGTTSWTADIPLLIGTNTVVIRAFDAAGNTAWRSITVTRK